MAITPKASMHVDMRTKDALIAAKQHPKETYDDVITRLLGRKRK